MNELNTVRWERERVARKEAERMLEEKSRDLFNANRHLEELTQKLQDQISEMHAVLQTAAEGIIRYGEDGAIHSFNASAEKIFETPAVIACQLNVRNLFCEGENTERALFPKEPLDVSAANATVEVLGQRGSSLFPADVAVGIVKLSEEIRYTAMVRDLTHRKAIESQLVHARKMESVGQLAAGIAHEINTPMQFVSDNIKFLNDAFAAVKSLHDAYQPLYRRCRENGQFCDLVEQIDRLSHELDLDFMLAETPSALQQSIEGAARVSSIVQAMKEFSGTSSVARSKVDINRLVSNVVLVVGARWSQKITWKTELDPANPFLFCHTGLLNQALLNVVINSAEAIVDAPPAENSSVVIRTKLEPDFVEISIRDTGPGIDPEIRHRIFDPFFTTKGVGKGTGQGLAYVHDVIVEKHRGELLVDSALGHGTTFTMRIPNDLRNNSETSDHAPHPAS